MTASHLPPGVLLIQQGDMRLLGLDQRKEAFTLQRFGSGESGRRRAAVARYQWINLTAATAVEGSLLPAEAFFQLLDQQPEHAEQLLFSQSMGVMGRQQQAARPPLSHGPRTAAVGPASL